MPKVDKSTVSRRTVSNHMRLCLLTYRYEVTSTRILVAKDLRVCPFCYVRRKMYFASEQYGTIEERFPFDSAQGRLSTPAGISKKETERTPAGSPSRTSQRYKMAKRRSGDRPLRHPLPVPQCGWRDNRRGHDISCPYTSKVRIKRRRGFPFDFAEGRLSAAAGISKKETERAPAGSPSRTSQRYK